MSVDSWAGRLYETIKNILPWPTFYKCTPPLRCKPVDTDDDVEFYSDMRYLQDLADAILNDCHLAKCEAPDIFTDYVGRPLLQAAAIPVESVKFWDQFGDWPVDWAATLISLWRFDRELEAWMQQDDAA